MNESRPVAVRREDGMAKNSEVRKRPPRVAKPTLAAVVTSELREAIISGRIPPGSQMNEVELAARFSTSRGPVREGMQRLVQEGLLVSSPHRGIFVPVLSAADVEDLYFARSALERGAMLRIVERGISAATIASLDQVLGEMELAMAEGDTAAVAAADLHFHEVLVSAAGSPRLMQMYQALVGQMRLGLNLVIETYVERAELVSEHKAIVRQLKTGDRKALLAAIDEHFDVALDDLAADGAGHHHHVNHSGVTNRA
ncbi:DNA-binding GntR family transcriptional regulator [Kribbella sp. VKM Ac-2527]|uniref:DNA-binding GntR family transcriptional regulator n=1 Tax=Kribbella caucasensis TaxID=2512215 RepID=A0A4R6KDZ7_9ACTN|nr:GntR family transcriptional regulator [Kribbella sp. VKM Ac-2527]TDO48487.1 DNA-binding GntR family transcriptional regulator [Kribbella sp. VKM Ac-2527]